MNSTTNAIPQCRILRPEFSRPAASVLTLKTRLRLVLAATLMGFVPLISTSPTVGNWVTQLGQRVVANRMESIARVQHSLPPDASISVKLPALDAAGTPGKAGIEDRRLSAIAADSKSASNNWTLPQLPSPASRFSVVPGEMMVRLAIMRHESIRQTVVDRAAVDPKSDELKADEPKAATRTGRPIRRQAHRVPALRVPPGRLNAN